MAEHVVQTTGGGTARYPTRHGLANEFTRSAGGRRRPPIPGLGKKNWSRENIAWLAGLIEGEGYIYTSRERSINIGLSMTDEDVVRKAHAISGLGAVYGPCNPTKNFGGRFKQFWIWSVKRSPHAYALAAAIFPFMGARRSAKIIAAMRAYSSRPPFQWRLHGTAARYKKAGCRCEPCKAAMRKRSQTRIAVSQKGIADQSLADLR